MFIKNGTLVEENHMNELLPCPFCGGKPSIWQTGTKKHSFIECEKCNATSYYFVDEKEAIEKWNTRASKWISVEKRLPEVD